MPIRKPGTTPTGDYFHVPVAQKEGRWPIRTITIDAKAGIKALVQVRPEGEAGADGGATVTLSYLFDKQKWTMTKAKRWVYTHLTQKQKKQEHFQDFPEKPYRIKADMSGNTNLSDDDYGMPRGLPSGQTGSWPMIEQDNAARHAHTFSPYLKSQRHKVRCGGCGVAFATDIHGLFWQNQDKIGPQYNGSYWQGENPQETLGDNEALQNHNDILYDDDNADEHPFPILVDDPGYPERDESDANEDALSQSLEQPATDSLDQGTLGGPTDYRQGGPLGSILVGVGEKFCPACRTMKQARGSDDIGMFRRYQIMYNDGGQLSVMAMKDDEDEESDD